MVTRMLLYHHVINKQRHEQNGWHFADDTPKNYFLLFSLRSVHLFVSTLQWRHNERDGVPSHQPHDCLLHRLFGCRSTSLACVRGIYRGPVNSPHKGPVARKMFPFDDVTMITWELGVCVESTTNHHLNQWWPSSIYASTAPNTLKTRQMAEICQTTF